MLNSIIENNMITKNISCEMNTVYHDDNMHVESFVYTYNYDNNKSIVVSMHEIYNFNTNDVTYDSYVYATNIFTYLAKTYNSFYKTLAIAIDDAFINDSVFLTPLINFYNEMKNYDDAVNNQFSI